MNQYIKRLTLALFLLGLVPGQGAAQQVPAPREQAIGGAGYVVIEGGVELGGKVVGGSVVSSHSQLHTALYAGRVRFMACEMACAIHVTSDATYRFLAEYTAWPSAPVEPNPPVEPPVDPNPGGVVFSSSWSTALGTSQTAIGDGGLWPHNYCGASILEVVPGAQHGWTLTRNVLQVTNAGSSQCRMVENQSSIPSDADDYYVRLYIRVAGVGGGGYTFHSVKMAVLNPIQAVYWGIDRPVTDASYVPRFRLLDASSMAQFGYRGPVLIQEAWYRFEYHVEYFDSANPLRYRVWPRIYDAGGTLVADASMYRSNDGTQTETLAQHYEAGAYGLAASRDRGRYLALGYEGTSGNNDVGGRWYYAAVEVRTDGFPGPVGGGQ